MKDSLSILTDFFSSLLQTGKASLFIHAGSFFCWFIFWCFAFLMPRSSVPFCGGGSMEESNARLLAATLARSFQVQVCY